MTKPMYQCASLDYDSVHGEGEERGLSVFRMTLNFLIQSMMDCVVIFENSGQKGHLTPDLAWKGATLRLRDEDENLYELMSSQEVVIRELVIHEFLSNTEHFSFDQGVIIPKFAVPALNWDIPQDMQPAEIDGVEYPVISNMTPIELQRYSENPEYFHENFPEGDFEKVCATAQHLRDERITVETYHESYIYKIAL